MTNLCLLACDLEFMDFSIEIDCKCLFNTRFSSFYFHLYLLRNSKVLFDRAQHHQKVTVLCGIMCHLLVCFSTLPLRLDSNDASHPPALLQLCEFPLLRHFQDIPFTRVYSHPLAPHLHDVAVFLFSFQSG